MPRRSRTEFSSSSGTASVHCDTGVATSRTRSDSRCPDGTAASRRIRTTPLGWPSKSSSGSTECPARAATSDRKRSPVVRHEVVEQEQTLAGLVDVGDALAAPCGHDVQIRRRLVQRVQHLLAGPAALMLTSTVSPTGHSQRLPLSGEPTRNGRRHGSDQRHHEVPYSANARSRPTATGPLGRIAVITPLAYVHRPFVDHKVIWDEKRVFSQRGRRSPSTEGGERRAQWAARNRRAGGWRGRTKAPAGGEGRNRLVLLRLLGKGHHPSIA